jgi:hypothetical protein
VNIARQFQQVGIILADDRFISILKEMAMPSVSQVEVDHITGKEFAHTLGNRLATGTNQQMKVVRKEGPRIDMEIPIQAEIRQSVQKIFPVLIRAENGCPLDAPSHDVMQSPGCIESWLSRHIGTLHPFAPSVNKLF